MKLVE